MAAVAAAAAVVRENQVRLISVSLPFEKEGERKNFE